jgi:hypothetical protein
MTNLRRLGIALSILLVAISSAGAQRGTAVGTAGASLKRLDALLADIGRSVDSVRVRRLTRVAADEVRALIAMMR